MHLEECKPRLTSPVLKLAKGLRAMVRVSGIMVREIRERQACTKLISLEAEAVKRWVRGISMPPSSRASAIVARGRRQ
jgi:hypothetical protein